MINVFVWSLLLLFVAKVALFVVTRFGRIMVRGSLRRTLANISAVVVTRFVFSSVDSLLFLFAAKPSTFVTARIGFKVGARGTLRRTLAKISAVVITCFGISLEESFSFLFAAKMFSPFRCRTTILSGSRQ
jgi:hypothetical protein